MDHDRKPHFDIAQSRTADDQRKKQTQQFQERFLEEPGMDIANFQNRQQNRAQQHCREHSIYTPEHTAHSHRDHQNHTGNDLKIPADTEAACHIQQVTAGDVHHLRGGGNDHQKGDQKIIVVDIVGKTVGIQPDKGQNQGAAGGQHHKDRQKSHIFIGGKNLPNILPFALRQKLPQAVPGGIDDAVEHIFQHGENIVVHSVNACQGCTAAGGKGQKDNGGGFVDHTGDLLRHHIACAGNQLRPGGGFQIQKPVVFFNIPGNQQTIQQCKEHGIKPHHPHLPVQPDHHNIGDVPQCHSDDGKEVNDIFLLLGLQQHPVGGGIV